MSTNPCAGATHQALVLVKSSAPGYQTVVALTDREDPMRCFNKLPTARQYEAVQLASTQVASAFLRVGIFPQMELLGARV